MGLKLVISVFKKNVFNTSFILRDGQKMQCWNSGFLISNAEIFAHKLRPGFSCARDDAPFENLVGASNNVVGIFCPLGVIGLSYLSKSGGDNAPRPPTPTALKRCLLTYVCLHNFFRTFFCEDIFLKDERHKSRSRKTALRRDFPVFCKFFLLFKRAIKHTLPQTHFSTFLYIFT